MEKVNWHQFWQTYRKTEIISEQDLFFEVGKTVNQKAISAARFRLLIERVARGLALNRDDKLLELCCGNGLMSLPLASIVSGIQAVDFAQHLIEHARKFRQAPNIDYICADAVGHLRKLAETRSFVPSKILLGDALGYFELTSLQEILKSAITLTGNHVFFLATDIPSDELKWNFYDTPDRVRRYEENLRSEKNSNDGIGHWWSIAELEEISSELELELIVARQPKSLSTYRVDAFYKSRN